MWQMWLQTAPSLKFAPSRATIPSAALHPAITHYYKAVRVPTKASNGGLQKLHNHYAKQALTNCK